MSTRRGPYSATEPGSPEWNRLEDVADANRKRLTGDAFMIGFLSTLAKVQPGITLNAALTLAHSKARANGYSVAEL